MNNNELTNKENAVTQKSSLLPKKEIALILILLALSALLGLGYWAAHRTPALRAEVTVDGKLVETLDLSSNQEITIDGANGGTNHLIVRDGEIWCDKASCPDKVCVRQGKQSLDGEVIVCLPNKMIVQVVGKRQ